MDRDNSKVLASEIINNSITAFLEVMSDLSINRRKNLFVNTDFPIFHPANNAYFEYKRYANLLEWKIRDYLVIDVLLTMLSNKEICPDIVNVLIYHDKRIFGGASYSNEQYSNNHELDFIVVSKNESIGYRLSGICARPREIKKILKRNHISHIEIIDWSDTYSFESGKIEFGVDHSQRTLVYYVTLHRFLAEYFNEDICELYISSVNDAVKKANDIIDYQTIPTMSPRFFSDYKSQKIKELQKTQFNLLSFCVFDKNGNYTDNSYPLLLTKDYEVLDSRFLKSELYKAIIGDEDFSKCFLISEYLFDLFKTGKTIFLDFSPIVTGYFKSIELLLYRIMEIWLSQEKKDLWIKGGNKNLAKEDGKPWCRFNPNKKAKDTQVEFKSEHRVYFSIEMGPLIWLLHDNPNDWLVSNNGAQIIIDCLNNYKDSCRNEYLHKRIINDFNAVINIRNNTLICLYYLLGGLKLSGNDKQDIYLLKADDDSYERLYKELLNIDSPFYDLQFDSNKIIKAYRLKNQKKTIYDEKGKIKTPIKFVLVNDFSKLKYYSDEENMKIIISNTELLLSKDSVPVKMWWYKNNGDRVEINW